MEHENMVHDSHLRLFFKDKKQTNQTRRSSSRSKQQVEGMINGQVAGVKMKQTNRGQLSGRWDAQLWRMKDMLSLLQNVNPHRTRTPPAAIKLYWQPRIESTGEACATQESSVTMETERHFILLMKSFITSCGPGIACIHCKKCSFNPSFKTLHADKINLFDLFWAWFTKREQNVKD